MVNVPPLGPGARGQLTTLIEEAVETALQRRGAPPSGLNVHAESTQIIEDQLYRAQRVGAHGIAVALESLSGLIGAQGTLGDDDSACLRFYSSAASRYPFALWLSSTDVSLRAYGPPLALQDLLGAKAELDTRTILPSTAPALTSTVTSPKDWRHYAKLIDDAHGPKPLSAVEKLFEQAYTPLAEAVRQGENDRRARQSLLQFAEAFEKSYKEAFIAAKVTHKRPTMVLDIPGIASRIGRLHGTRGITLVLVDGMRYDVGLRLEHVLQEELRGTAVLAERVLLWSALPAVTAVQLRLLERGVQALSEPLDSQELREAELPIGRGRTASILRRIRVGGRELHKLDVIQADLTTSGLPEAQRLDALARAVAFPLLQLTSQLPAQTLLFIFGDHGFVLPSHEKGTGPAMAAGARPEEVLVAGQAWVVGSVH